MVSMLTMSDSIFFLSSRNWHNRGILHWSTCGTGFLTRDSFNNCSFAVQGSSPVSSWMRWRFLPVVDLMSLATIFAKTCTGSDLLFLSFLKNLWYLKSNCSLKEQWLMARDGPPGRYGCSLEPSRPTWQKCSRPWKTDQPFHLRDPTALNHNNGHTRDLLP